MRKTDLSGLGDLSSSDQTCIRDRVVRITKRSSDNEGATRRDQSHHAEGDAGWGENGAVRLKEIPPILTSPG
jgi:hypothetical protein